MSNHGRIDADGFFTKRQNRSSRGLDVLRKDFRCPKCGHDKAFSKREWKECTRCKTRMRK